MALVVEDGTGRTDAESYNSVADIATYAAARGLTWPGSATSTSLQEACARRAFDYLNNEQRYYYRGLRLTSLQTGSFPRKGVVMRGGLAVADGVIPTQLKWAHAELAIRAAASATSGAVADLQPDLDRGGRIQTTRVDVLSTTYFDDAPSETVIAAVQGLLAPFLRDGTKRDPVPYLSQPEAETPFVSGEFDFT